MLRAIYGIYYTHARTRAGSRSADRDTAIPGLLLISMVRPAKCVSLTSSPSSKAFLVTKLVLYFIVGSLPRNLRKVLLSCIVATFINS